MNISTSQKNNTHVHKYIKVYHFVLLMKWKGKKGPKRNKVKTENAKMKVIKWERIWDTKRERERERDIWYLLQLQAKWPGTGVVEENNIALGITF